MKREEGRRPPLPTEVRVLKPGLEGGSGEGRKLFVVGFDPGGKTGWSVMRINIEHLRCYGFSGVCLHHPDPEVFSWSAGYFEGPEPYQAELMVALLRGTWMHGEGVWDVGNESDLMVCTIEPFTLMQLGNDETLLSPVRIAAMFRALSWRRLYVPVIGMGRVDAMRVFTDRVLQKLNLWPSIVGKDGEHPRDALRQAGLVARAATDPRWLSEISRKMNWLGGEMA